MTLNNQVSSAVAALLELVAKASANDKNLLPQIENVQLNLCLSCKPHEGFIRPHFIELPNPIHPLNTEVCIFTADDHKALVESHIQSGKLPQLKEVISITDLKTLYKTAESRRVLCAKYGLFISQDTVLSLLPSLIGKVFFHRKKFISKIRISKNFVKDFGQVFYKAAIYHPSGSLMSIKVGNVGMHSDALVENILSAPKLAAAYIPGGIQSIASVSIKTTRSVALPVSIEAFGEVLSQEATLAERAGARDTDKGKNQKSKPALPVSQASAPSTPSAQLPPSAQDTASLDAKNSTEAQRDAITPSKKAKKFKSPAKKNNMPSPGFAAASAAPKHGSNPSTPNKNGTPTKKDVALAEAGALSTSEGSMVAPSTPVKQIVTTPTKGNKSEGKATIASPVKQTKVTPFEKSPDAKKAAAQAEPEAVSATSNPTTKDSQVVDGEVSESTVTTKKRARQGLVEDAELDASEPLTRVTRSRVGAKSDTVSEGGMIDASRGHNQAKDKAAGGPKFSPYGKKSKQERGTYLNKSGFKASPSPSKHKRFRKHAP